MKKQFRVFLKRYNVYLAVTLFLETKDLTFNKYCKNTDVKDYCKNISIITSLNDNWLNKIEPKPKKRLKPIKVNYYEGI